MKVIFLSPKQTVCIMCRKEQEAPPRSHLSFQFQNFISLLSCAKSNRVDRVEPKREAASSIVGAESVPVSLISELCVCCYSCQSNKLAPCIIASYKRYKPFFCASDCPIQRLKLLEQRQRQSQTSDKKRGQIVPRLTVCLQMQVQVQVPV